MEATTTSTILTNTTTSTTIMEAGVLKAGVRVTVRVMVGMEDTEVMADMAHQE